jgi:ATP-dependent protease Clp ATPase subunit
MVDERRCSFCKKTEHEVGKLAAGPDVFICAWCARFATEIIENSSSRFSWRGGARKFIVKILRPLRRVWSSAV